MSTRAAVLDDEGNWARVSWFMVHAFSNNGVAICLPGFSGHSAAHGSWLEKVYERRRERVAKSLLSSR
jgi:hypothetical protein